MKDQFGVEVNVGDYVLHFEPNTPRLMVSKVHELKGTTKVNVDLLQANRRVTNADGTSTLIGYEPISFRNVVKVPKEWAIERYKAYVPRYGYKRVNQ
jgi:hypothetical protein